MTMPRKANPKPEETVKPTVNKTKWIIICIISLALLIVILGRLGKFGTVANNILTFLFGSVFVVPLLTLFSYGIYAIFLSHKFEKSVKVIIGLFLLNITLMLVCSYITCEVETFQQYWDYILYGLGSVAKENVYQFTGGLIGNLLYCCLVVLIDRTGILIALICMFVVAMILVIPGSLYAKWVNDFKAAREARKQERIEAEKAEEEERIRHEAEEEERKLKLAEEYARAYEEAANERQEAEQFAPVVEPKHDDVLSTKSKFFINLNQTELNGKVDDTGAIPVVEDKTEEQITTDKKVLKVKKKNGSYHKPPISLLNNTKNQTSTVNKTSAKVKGEKVIEILKTFDINAELVNTHIGPSVTKFEIKPDSAVKINRIQNIADNIKMELAAKEIRIEAPIPGRSAVGIEIPNVESTLVSMYDMMSHIPSNLSDKKLLFALGKDLMGKETFCDLERMPHLLIAGATGSGKSVCENAIITSYIMRSNPDELKLVLIDPKKVEFTPYHDIPHLLWPVITDVTMASNMLKKIVVIMEERYELFSTTSVKNIQGYNAMVDDFNRNLTDGAQPMNKLPYIVIIIDELADMMAVAGKDVELSIQRITQLARASGIHLIVATQRPSTDVITGLIKNNMPSRISFALTSQIDSRTIIDQAGAEKLLGNGDMLYKPQEENAPIRLQGVYVTEEEVRKICDYSKREASPEYEDSYFEFQRNMNGVTVGSASGVDADKNDSLYDEVVEFVKQKQAASTSLLQRRFGIGYNRAARLIDTLEDKGIIGPANGSKPREVYVKPDED